jgi:hypothetical protein
VVDVEVCVVEVVVFLVVVGAAFLVVVVSSSPSSPLSPPPPPPPFDGPVPYTQEPAETDEKKPSGDSAERTEELANVPVVLFTAHKVAEKALREIEGSPRAPFALVWIMSKRQGTTGLRPTSSTILATADMPLYVM